MIVTPIKDLVVRQPSRVLLSVQTSARKAPVYFTYLILVFEDFEVVAGQHYNKQTYRTFPLLMAGCYIRKL